MHIDLLTPSLSTKERLQLHLNVQFVAHPFYWPTYSINVLLGVLQTPQGADTTGEGVRECGSE